MADIFAYTDYRKFLSEAWNERKVFNRGFSRRTTAARRPGALISGESPVRSGFPPVAGLLVCLLAFGARSAPTPTTADSLAREAAIGPGVPAAVSRTLDVREVPYLDFDGRHHQGRIVCARSRCRDLCDLFDTLARAGFPVRSVVPVSAFGGSDSVSMAHDNTYCFAWRGMWGSGAPSMHARGLALDLNPRENPAFHRGRIFPAGARTDPSAPGTLSDTSLAVRFLRSRGWRWGAHWKRVQDRQHFEVRE